MNLTPEDSFAVLTMESAAQLTLDDSAQTLSGRFTHKQTNSQRYMIIGPDVTQELSQLIPHSPASRTLAQPTRTYEPKVK